MGRDLVLSILDLSDLNTLSVINSSPFKNLRVTNFNIFINSYRI